MYLIDTNIISESRKDKRANPGVRTFLNNPCATAQNVFLSAVTIGELRRGVDLLRHRGDLEQAPRLDDWLLGVLEFYADEILPFDKNVAQIWGRLCVPHSENALDKQIAATALAHNLILVTRNAKHFMKTGVQLLNPFDEHHPIGERFRLRADKTGIEAEGILQSDGHFTVLRGAFAVASEKESLKTYRPENEKKRRELIDKGILEPSKLPNGRDGFVLTENYDFSSRTQAWSVLAGYADGALPWEKIE
jgi:predicted nucleic acid-binding protein